MPSIRKTIWIVSFALAASSVASAQQPAPTGSAAVTLVPRDVTALTLVDRLSALGPRARLRPFALVARSALLGVSSWLSTARYTDDPECVGDTIVGDDACYQTSRATSTAFATDLPVAPTSGPLARIDRLAPPSPSGLRLARTTFDRRLLLRPNVAFPSPIRGRELGMALVLTF